MTVTTGSATARRPVSFSTGGLPEAQRIALWEDHNAHALIGLRCHTLGGTPFDGTELNLELEQLHLARVRSNAHVVERPAEVIRKHPTDAVAVYLTLVGEAFFYHDDGVLTLRPGQALICDADRPFMRGFSHGLEELAIKVPRPLFRELTGLKSLNTPLVRGFAGGDVPARTFARLIDRALRPEGGEPVDERIALDLLASMAGSRPVNLGTVHLANARTFIEDHLTDSGLTAARVATGIGISERHLSRAFAAAGTTVPQYVLARRLERARALLASSPQLPVGEVAARCGFGSATHFSQAFRARFGLRATDLRRQARAGRLG
ncbi:AraC family transcriptional regulator [Micromonospora phytophila]|uniref:AraC family transcriptional regulator n=1 Tax=Micromonospora phytophila TaxID=709888 RepID=UPI00202E9D2D|nr:AraC family transcriptional regulator [Micromonospora phytophila]MCM0675356.1 AraC family transcriptional regulator [Micromonospora phytophila]